MTTTVPDELTAEVRAHLDQAIADLEAGAARWAALPLTDRAALVERTIETVAAQAEAWAKGAIKAKGIAANAEGDEWLGGPYSTLGVLQLVAQSLRALADGRSPAADLKTGTAPGGRTTVRVLPASIWDQLTLHGFTADVWLAKGVTADQARTEAGLGARHLGENHGVGLVLGAGNASSIGPLDCLYELVAFNRTSVLKLNPTFASLLPVYEKALAPFIEAGLLRIFNGAAAIGGYLSGHDGIGHVHITGSGVTHDAIVWGVGAEAQERRANDDPKLKKEISSELGGVAPIIVVPGKWSKRDLRYQAEHVATMRMVNEGHACVAGQTVVLSSDWPQREAFLAELRKVLDEQHRTPWYPGYERKLDEARASYPTAEDHNGSLLVDVTGEAPHDLFTTEYFGPVLGYTTLPGTGVEFLRAAIDFSNKELVGTLGANVLIKPRDRKALGAAFDEAIADLHYGTIAINSWTGVAFTLPGAAWGAFPGHTLADVGSGIGVVHNGFLLDHVERTIVTGPFRPAPRSLVTGEFALAPKPPWFVSHANAPETARLFTYFTAKPSMGQLPKILKNAMKG